MLKLRVKRKNDESRKLAIRLMEVHHRKREKIISMDITINKGCQNVIVLIIDAQKEFILKNLFGDQFFLESRNSNTEFSS
jgi:ribosomal protein S11